MPLKPTRVSATLLKQRLDTLEHAGIVARKTSGDTGAPEYFLTDAGQGNYLMSGVGVTDKS